MRSAAKAAQKSKVSQHKLGAVIVKGGRLHDLAGSEIFVSRFTKGGRVGMARPCPTCASLIESVGITRVSYTTDCGNSLSYKV